NSAFNHWAASALMGSVAIIPAGVTAKTEKWLLLRNRYSSPAIWVISRTGAWAGVCACAQGVRARSRTKTRLQLKVVQRCIVVLLLMQEGHSNHDRCLCTKVASWYRRLSSVPRPQLARHLRCACVR